MRRRVLREGAMAAASVPAERRAPGGEPGAKGVPR
jgi:hypothetical protein